MPEYHRTEIKTGVFVLVALVLFIVAMLTVSDIGRKMTSKATYEVLLTHSYQIKNDAPVTYSGMTVGRVTNVARITPKQTDLREPFTNDFYSIKLTLEICISKFFFGDVSCVFNNLENHAILILDRSVGSLNPNFLATFTYSHELANLSFTTTQCRPKVLVFR